MINKKLSTVNPFEVQNYLEENDYKIVTCYNCQEKYFELSYMVKALNFCSDCWNKKAVK